MTDENPNQANPPGGDPFAHEPHGDAGTNGADNASAKGREWLAQLETMINDVTTQAAPVARQVAAKAAELTAVAAIKAGPFAQRAANVTTDASQKLAERATASPRSCAARPGDAGERRAVGRRRGRHRRRERGRAARPQPRSRTRRSAEDQTRPAARSSRVETRPTTTAPPSRDAGGLLRILADHERSTHRPPRRRAAPAQGRDRGQLRQVPPRAPRRPDRLDAPRARRRARGARSWASPCARASSRSRATSTSSSTPRSCAPPATTATSRAACRSRATSPTSPATRRSGSSPRTASARRSRSPGSGLLGRALQHELDHLDGKLYIDYLDSMEELIAGRAARRRGRARSARSRANAGVRPGRRRTTDASGRSSSASARSPSRPSSALAANPLVRVVGVVTATAASRPGGGRRARRRRSTRAARALGLRPVLTPPRLRHPDAIAAILALRPDLAVLADYGQIVPPPLLDLPHGALNLHPSALPRFRGASPIPATILAGDREAAVTLMRMDAGPRHGADRRAAAGRRSTARRRRRRSRPRLAALGAELLAESLPGWLDGSLRAVPQADEGVVLTRPLRREDGRLDAARPAAELERAVRAYAPWPGTFLELGGERLVVDEAASRRPQPGDTAGELVRERARLPALATADGRLVLRTVTPAGTRAMPGEDWLRGRRDLA